MPNTDERSFARYVALGDSISIDDYPSLDLGTRLTGEPAEEVGAASLLYRNRDDLWPEFAGRDLSKRWPGIEYLDHTADGATTWNVLEAQLPNLPRDDGEPTLVTLTAGGNDLLQLFVSEPVEPVVHLVNFLYWTGWRVGTRGNEGALNLTWDRVDWTTGSFVVGSGSKTNKPGRFFFSEVPAVEAILLALKGRSKKWVFATREGQRLGYKYSLNAFKEAQGKAGLEGYRLHDYRDPWHGVSNRGVSRGRRP